MINGKVKCPDISPVLIAPKYKPGFLLLNSLDPFEFLPFISTSPDIPACGFEKYEITAVDENGTSINIVNPDESNSCTLTSCLKRIIPTDSTRVFFIKILGFSRNPTLQPVEAHTSVEIVDCSVEKS